MSQPVVSVVIVGDYAAGTPGSIEDLRLCLKALASQDFAEPAEFIVSEWEGYRDAIPNDLDKLLPGVRVVFSEAQTTLELKNEGVRRAHAPLVVILDSDCTSAPDWLRSAVDALRTRPDAGAISGRTLSPAKTRRERIAALAVRSIGDEGTSGPTKHLALNNIAFRREVIEKHPFSSQVGPCGYTLCSQSLFRSGYRLYFEPRMQVVHDSITFEMERDIRRLMGISIIQSRKLEPGVPYASLVRLGYGSIPIIVLGKSLLTARRCWLRRKLHGVRWYEVPFAMLAGFVRHLLEAPGMILAFRGQLSAPSRYR